MSVQLLEQLLLNRLSRELDNIIWAHRVKMTPPTLRLTDSATYWACYNHSEGSLSVSRRLVEEHSWFAIVSVLRHELAHRLVALAAGGRDAHLHKDRFQWACQQLGVPDYFSGASCSLQSFRLEFQSDFTGADSTADAGPVAGTHLNGRPNDKLLSKVRKLLALAGSNNEHEALLAMNKVRELYAKHQIESVEGDQVGHQPGATRVSGQGHYFHLVISLCSKRLEAHVSKICSILIDHFFVRVIFFKEYHLSVGEDYQAAQLIGTRENVLMAEYVYHFLTQQLVSLVKTKKKEKTLSSRRAIKSYRLGVLTGFSEKLEKTNAEAKAAYRSVSSAGITKSGAPASVNSTSTGLIVLGQALLDSNLKKQTDDYLDQVFPRLISQSRKRQWVDTDAYTRGNADGKKITLHRGVSSSHDSGRYLE